MVGSHRSSSPNGNGEANPTEEPAQEQQTNLAQGTGEEDPTEEPAQEQQTLTKPRKRYSFFDFPENVRQRIYEYTNLHRPCTVRLDPMPHQCFYIQEGRRYSVQDFKTLAHFVNTWPCLESPFPEPLLRVSRTMLEDIKPVFARNAFYKILVNQTDLRAFTSRLRWSFSHLARLHIDLRARDRRYLRLEHNTTWNMWLPFCHRVRMEMPNLSVFSLNCKIRRPEVADWLLRHMEEAFPRLLNCAFHFDDVVHRNIQPRIQKACARLTSKRGDNPFPFMSLPKEIQLLVLEYYFANRSDPVAYNGGNAPSVGFSCVRGMVCFQRRRQLRVHPLNPFICCGKCSPLRTMCFCQLRQSAFSTSCACFVSPIPCFLVCREFYHMATRIFYSSSTFFMIDEDPDAMLRITKSMPTSSFQYIRSLAFQFPATTRVPSRPAHRAEEAALLSWAFMRRFIREHFNLPRLSLYILDLGTQEWTRNTVASRTRYLRRLLYSFRDLEGLQDFWAYLANDQKFEDEARRVVLGERANHLPPPRFVRDFVSGGLNEHPTTH